MNVEIKEMPELRVGAVRHVGPYQEIGRAFERLGQIAGAAGLVTPGASLLAIYHDDPRTTAPDQLRSDAGVVVPETARLPKELAEEHVAAGKYAYVVHKGPYDTLPAMWGQLMGEWLPASGHRVRSGASLEIYKNTPMTTPPPDLVTELYVPIA